MFGLKTLDVGIGMALMFLFVSLICSAVREFGELLFKTRASSLERGVREMFNEATTEAGAAGLTEKLYNHPLISALYGGNYSTAAPKPVVSGSILRKNRLPSYIPAESFANAVFQIARDEFEVKNLTTLASSELRTWIGEDPQTPLPKAIRSALDASDDDLAVARTSIEHWFNSTMDRVSGWYKRRTQVWLFVLGLGCAVLMNIDALTIMKRLSTDDALRNQVVSAAGSVLADCANTPSNCPSTSGSTAPASTVPAVGDQLDRIRSATAQMSQVNWPIGWAGGYPDPQFRLAARDVEPGAALSFWLPVVGGWLITAFGVTFGASFWFDVLNRFMVVRSTIKPDEKSPKEKSKS